jgi:hypothetical protein
LLLQIVSERGLNSLDVEKIDWFLGRAIFRVDESLISLMHDLLEGLFEVLVRGL